MALPVLAMYFSTKAVVAGVNRAMIEDNIQSFAELIYRMVESGEVSEKTVKEWLDGSSFRKEKLKLVRKRASEEED